MKISLSKAALLKAIKNVEGFIGKNSALPALQAIKLTSDSNGELELTASNMDAQASSVLEGKGDGPVSVMIPLPAIMLIKSLKGETVDFQIDEARITLKAGKSNYKISGSSTENFPSLEVKGELTGALRITAGELLKIIKYTLFAAHNDKKSKIQVCGVYFVASPEVLETVATDAHRLSIYRTKVNYGCNGSFKALIPFETVGYIASLLAEIKPEVEIDLALKGPTAIFGLPNVMIISRLIEAPFPNYAPFIAMSESTSIIEMPAAALEDAVARVSLMDKSYGVCNFACTEKLAILTAAEAGLGEGAEEISDSYLFKGAVDSDGVLSESAEFRLQGKYILDFLRNVAAETIVAKWDAPKTRVFFTLANGDDFMHMILPIRK